MVTRRVSDVDGGLVPGVVASLLDGDGGGGGAVVSGDEVGVSERLTGGKTEGGDSVESDLVTVETLQTETSHSGLSFNDGPLDHSTHLTQ